LHQELVVLNASAANSLAEGLGETLTLHRLGGVAALGVSFKTTNLIENVMSPLERKTQRVARWRTSDQRLRWCAATLIQIEPRLRRIKGYEQLPLLQATLRNTLHLT
jgi:putative transposase